MLKQLMLSKKIEGLRSTLNDYLEEETKLTTRSEELEASIDEAKTDEEIEVVEEEVEKLEEEKKELEEKKSKLEGEIKELEQELEQLNSKKPNNSQRSGGEEMKLETRTQAIDRLNEPEVREFYEKLSTAVRNKRALSGEDLVIPNTVLNRIQVKVGDYSSLYKEVEVISMSGTARAIFDGAIPEAIWTEMCDPVQELATAFEAVELDGYKVGGFIPVCNAVLEDSMIDLANYVEDRIARAIAKAIDKAILIGAGALSKQPEGIVPAITANAVTSDFTSADLLPHIGAIDNGEDNTGEIIAVMKRQTFYNHFLRVATASDGREVAQNVNTPNIAGLRVVFSQYAPDDAVIFGDFKKYLLGERRGIQLTSSTDVRFIEDQTVFKGTARYDGKPVTADSFVLVNYSDVPEA